jgi:tRNA(Ile)-lysidine synthase
MLHQLINIPHNEHFYVACSGGVDSMAIASFYKLGNKKFTLAYFNHGTQQANSMEKHVLEWGMKNDVPVVVGTINDARTLGKGHSPEEYFRTCRYEWFDKLPVSSIITCHHLNDVAETWIFSNLHGEAKLIAARRGRFLRPFLTTPKENLTEWCLRHGVDWVEDRSNNDLNIPRNLIRHVILPQSLKINPGLLKVLRKKLLAREKNINDNR